MTRTPSLLIFVSFFALLGCNDSDPPADGDAGAPPVTPAPDASTPVDDAGSTTLPSAPEIDIQVAATCESFTPCGGDVIGTWAYTDGCVTVDLSSIQEACPAATIDLVATATGVVRIDALSVQREATVHAVAEIGVPAACAFLGCGELAGLLASDGDASCTDAAGGGCDCTLRSTDSTFESNGYRLEGNSLITDDGAVYDYCRDGDDFHYGEPDDEGVFLLSPL